MEKPLQLCYPVRTLDQRELLPAGAYLTRETMSDLMRAAKQENFPRQRFLEYGSIAADLQSCCQHPPYGQIFSDQKRKDEVFRTMQQMEFVQPMLDIYDYFRASDPYTYRHILTVFALSLLLAQDLIEDRRELAKEVAAAPNHDFGKVCVPLAVCKKTTLLSEHERQQLSHHAAAGYVLLSYYLKDPDHPAAITARDHHERCNGTGYPQGIHLQNRVVEIVTIGDVFDALICPRPYRPRSYDLRTALEEITRQAESGAISADVVNALICCNRKARPSYRDIEYSREQRGTPPPGNLYSGIIPCCFQPACACEEEDDAGQGQENSPKPPEQA
jgi:HD-GYP domain-containing protein (c-di-GMP phosphodiesterase class II)